MVLDHFHGFHIVFHLSVATFGQGHLVTHDMKRESLDMFKKATRQCGSNNIKMGCTFADLLTNPLVEARYTMIVNIPPPSFRSPNHPSKHSDPQLPLGNLDDGRVFPT